MNPEELVAIDGLRVHYRRHGDGPPLFLLHGWGGSSTSFAAVLPALQQRYTCFAVDLPGFGLSAPPPEPWGAGDYAELTASLVRRICPAPSVAVVGHSFGGRVGITLAARYPDLVSHLILVGAAGVRVPPPRSVALKTAAYRGARSLVGVLPDPLRESALRRLRGLFGSQDYQTAGALRGTMVKLIAEDLTPLLPLIACPTLLLWGEHDEEVPVAAAAIMHERIPKARLEILAGAGHFPFSDAPSEFIARLVGFLE